METDEFCLKWNNHHSVFISVLNSLLRKEMLVDVTLVAEGQFIEVHRLVLCACSKYFEDLLGSHKKKQSIVFLSNVMYTDLKALVDYMYKGEVNVAQDQLPRFLAAAEILKIKGLADKAGVETNSSPFETFAKQNQNAPNEINESSASSGSTKKDVCHKSSLSSQLEPETMQLKSVNSANMCVKNAPPSHLESQISSEMMDNEDNLANLVSVTPKIEADVNGESNSPSSHILQHEESLFHNSQMKKGMNDVSNSFSSFDSPTQSSLKATSSSVPNNANSFFCSPLTLSKKSCRKSLMGYISRWLSNSRVPVSLTPSQVAVNEDKRMAICLQCRKSEIVKRSPSGSWNISNFTRHVKKFHMNLQCPTYIQADGPSVHLDNAITDFFIDDGNMNQSMS